MIMHPDLEDDLRAQAMAAIACWIHRDQPGFDALVGSDEEAAVLLPICIGELITALEHLVGPPLPPGMEVAPLLPAVWAGKDSRPLGERVRAWYRQ
jgi:hypothetical protein